ncbi:MAG TPA: RnfH family protein [Woeseiaceae bacterium]|jgi:putative ubiquitin-RnfH superfamily antitoxin RatB of RatAB toxin-antitoxin module|nr:RnfH family protein [Woeseiaceae bacterium]
MQVEVVFAVPDRQLLEVVQVPADATVADAIRRSGIGRAFPDVDVEALQAGIWGKPVARDQLLKDGDRVELYRPLAMDPRDARRLKAGV